MNKQGQIGSIFLVLICIVAIGCALVAVGYAIKYFLLPVKVVTTQIDTASDVIGKTYTAENAIYNYEWFKTQYEKIQANRQQVQNTIVQIIEFKQTYGDNATAWDYETKQEYNRLNAVKIGLINQEENLVADYNARSKMANREIFNDKLPLNVDKMLW